MVGTRTSKGGRLQGLPSVRHLRDGPSPESEEEHSSDDDEGHSARPEGRVGRSRAKAGAKQRPKCQPASGKAGKADKAGKAANKVGGNRVAVLSDRRCVNALRCRTLSVLGLILRSCCDTYHHHLRCRQEPSMLIEGIQHTFWVACGKDRSDRLPARSRVRAKVRMASWFLLTETCGRA